MVNGVVVMCTCPLCGGRISMAQGDLVCGETYQCSECCTPLVFSVSSPEAATPSREPDGYVSAATAFDLRVMRGPVTERLIWKESSPEHNVAIFIGRR